MGWSWRIGRIAGIDVFVHFTFLLLLGYVAIEHYLHERSFADAAAGLLFILTLFSIVVLHELGHALAARRYGIQTRDITLLPIGGVARLERIPEDPKELVVALAGPAVNVALAAILFVVLWLTNGFAESDQVMNVRGSFLDKLFWINLSLAIFNLIPAFPMDGGRVLRALLALRLDHVQATQIAATIGQGMALLFGFIGLIAGQPMLIFIALFVWLGAAQEASMVQMRSALGGIPVERAMITEFHALHPDAPLSQAIGHVLNGFQDDFPVVENELLVGVLTKSDLLRGLAQQGADARVGDFMQKDLETADPHEMLEKALTRLQNHGGRSLPVLRNRRLVGLLTAENLGELLLIQRALRKAKQRTGPSP